MHVSGVEMPQQANSDAGATKKQGTTGDIFATFLKNANGQTFSTVRLEVGADLGRHIVADDPAPHTDDVKPHSEPRADAYDSGTQPDASEADSASSDEDIGSQQESVAVQPQTPQTPHTPQPEISFSTSSSTVPASTSSSTVPADSSSKVPTEPGLTEAAAGVSLGNPFAVNETGAPANTRESAAPRTATVDPGQTITPSSGKPSAVNPAAALQVPLRTSADAESKDVTVASRSGTNRLTAQVTETPQQLVSRPSNYLAATTVIAAQAEKPRPVGTSIGGPDGESVNRTGNLLLNNAAGRSAQTAGVQRAAAQNAGNTPTPAPSDAQQSALPAQAAPFTAALAANRTASALSFSGQASAGLARGSEAVSFSAPGGLTTLSSTSTEGARPAAPARPPVPPRVLTEQIAVQIQKSVGQGQDRISIQLKPAELGRVEIKLDVMQDGRVAATIIADRPETLDLLQRDARGLQQALQDAGLKSDNANLSFNLSGGNASGEEKATSAKSDGDTAEQDDDAQSLAEAEPETDTRRRRSGDGMIDLEV